MPAGGQVAADRRRPVLVPVAVVGVQHVAALDYLATDRSAKPDAILHFESSGVAGGDRAELVL